MSFLSSRPLHRDASPQSVDHPRCLPWRHVLRRQPVEHDVAGTSFEARREARLRDAFATISQDVVDHGSGQATGSGAGPGTGRGAEPGAGSLEAFGRGSPDHKAAAGSLSFESWMAGKSLR